MLRLGNRLDIEQSKNDKNFQVMEKKIEKESANLLAVYERYKNDVLKYSAGFLWYLMFLLKEKQIKLYLSLFKSDSFTFSYFESIIYPIFIFYWH